MIGFGAQNLVKDLISGIGMLMEDQFGIGDVIDMDKASGTVEAVGLRVTRLRDPAGVIWYVRNGEVLRVGNKSKGWSEVVVDIDVDAKADLVAATEVVTRVAAEVAAAPEFADVRQETLPRRLVVDADHFVGYLSTVSAYLQLPEGDRARALRSIAAVLPAQVEVDADLTVHLARRDRDPEP